MKVFERHAGVLRGEARDPRPNATGGVAAARSRTMPAEPARWEKFCAAGGRISTCATPADAKSGQGVRTLDVCRRAD